VTAIDTTAIKGLDELIKILGKNGVKVSHGFQVVSVDPPKLIYVNESV